MPEDRSDRGVWARARRLFLTGLVILLPLIITLWLLSLLFGIVNAVSTPLILGCLRLLGLTLVEDEAFSTYLAPLIGIVATLGLIMLGGALTTNFLGRRIVAAFDRLMLRIPLIKAIYGASRQLLDALNRKTDSFRRVVMVEFPRPGVYTIGFLARDGATLPASGRNGSLAGYSLVFLPTTPNPTSGWLAAIPDAEILPLDMSIEDGLKTIVSGGLVVPPAWDR